MNLMIRGTALKRISVFLTLAMVGEWVAPLSVFALTGGPSQPEVQSFEPVGTTEMVDLFSGDFTYNIPLLDVEGFPINIAYHSGVGMDDEASWVGLGWNINPGVVNRGLRGLPDDFNGDKVTRETHLKKNWTAGLTFNQDFEILGKNTNALNKAKNKNSDNGTGLNSDQNNNGDGAIDAKGLRNLNLGYQLGIYYNSYRGMGYEFALNSSFASSSKNQTRLTSGLGLNFDSQGGMDANGQVGLSRGLENEGQKGKSFMISGGYSSTTGLMEGSIWGHYRGDNKNSKGRAVQATGTFRVRNIYFYPTKRNGINTFSFSGGFRAGGEAFGLYTTFGGSFYFNRQRIRAENEEIASYGYFYAHNKQGRDGQFDITRSNDGAYTQNTPYLPLTSHNYDAFMISGEGTGGTFRAHRSDVGVVSDPDVSDFTTGLGLTAELGLGGTAKFGLDLKADYGWMTSGKWMSSRKKNREFNTFHNLRFFKPEVASNDSNFINYHAYEPFYLMTAGDHGRVNETYFNNRLGFQAVRIPVSDKFGNEIRPTNKLDGKDSDFGVNALLKQESRQVRNQVVSFLTVEEAPYLALEKCPSSYPHNSFAIHPLSRYVIPGGECMSRAGEVSPDAIAEVSVLNADGRRYIYGMAAYNNFQEDVTFNVVDNPQTISRDLSKGLVYYPSGANSTSNQYGEDEFYQKVRMPQYAHSFLLTGILSDDYVDVLEDGITYDDLGSAIKFNYTKVHSDYKWRVPHGGTSDRSASYNPGILADKYDDKGTYIYGEKEIWYVHSIESKNYVALFYTSPREDGYQVIDENGKRASSGSLYKLDSIAMFSKQALMEGDTTPLKMVHFEYDYSLCPNVENNSGAVVYNASSENINSARGKLTLKKIYFTYGKSRKGKISPYQFTYNEFNPDYNLQGYDRWGNYKPTPTHFEINDLSNASTRLSNNDDPYVKQNRDSADLYVGAWHLKKIKLPSGGIINIEFESDDYAYVQNVATTSMYKVIGLGNSSTFDTKSILYERKDENYNYVFFDLPFTVSSTIGSDSLNKLKDLLFKGWNEDLYFKFLVDIGNEQNDYEFISGYADAAESGFVSKTGGSTYDAGYVKLIEVSKNDKSGEDINPINYAAMNFLRLYQPKKLQRIFGGYELAPGEPNPFQAARNLIPAFKEVGKIFTNQFYELIKKSACKNIVLNKSFIRLNNPFKAQLGGGSRVKQITVSDNWSDISGTGEDAVYGQEYDYTTVDSAAAIPLRISSGVATYEPGIGNDENPMRRPSTDYIRQKRFLKTIPDERAYIQLPLGEEFMPPPSVGYSKITSKNIKPSENIHSTGTGFTINEFYTARDFPVRFDYTNVERHHPKDFIRNFLKVVSSERAYASQGYSIILNDMHGKPKAQSIYQEGGTEPFSKVVYNYYSSYDPKTGRYKLDNEVAILNKSDGSISSGRIGTVMDLVVDSRQQEGYHWNIGQQSNLDAFLAAFLPAVIPSFWPGFSSKRTDVGMVTTTKVINEFGILESTVVTENGASLDTKNILFDGETGEVFMTETQNEFGDPIYSYTVPAHYVYEGMSGAYKNIGFIFKNQYIEEGKVTLPNASSYFHEGDEVAFYVNDRPVPVRGWVVKPDPAQSDLLYVTRSGDPIQFGSGVKVTVKIIRSGRRNMQNVPIGTVVTLNEPGASNWNYPLEVINASAVEFSEQWSRPYAYVPRFRYNYQLPGNYSGGGAGCIPTDTCPQACYDSLMGLMTSSKSSNPFLKSNTSKEINPKDFEPYYSCVRDANDGCAMCFKLNWDEYFPAKPIQKPGFIAMDFTNPDIPKFEDLAQVGSYDEYPEEFAFADNSWMPSSHGPSAYENFGQSNVSSILKTQAGNAPEWSYEDLDLSLVDSTFWYQVGPCRYMSITLRLYCTIVNANAAYQINRIGDGKGDVDICCRIRSDDGALFQYRFYDYCPGSGYEGGSDPRPDYDSASCDFKYDSFVVNPYIQGIKGMWRPQKSWVVLDERGQTSTTNTRKDGTYDLSSFWKTPSGGNNWRRDTTGKWVWSEKMTKYSKTGQNIETVNPLNIYSAAIYGYGENLPIAVGSNLKLRQMAFDGAEDHPYVEDVHHDHFSFRYANGIVYSDSAHTGLNSIKVEGGTSLSVTRTMVYCENLPPQGKNVDDGYYPDPCEFTGRFSPDTGLYYVSAWIRQHDSLPRTGYTGDTIRFTFYKDANFSDPRVATLTSTGLVIEGWQKVEGVISVPDTVMCYTVELESGSDYFTLFDDIRIFPYKANMRAFVYNPKTLRLMAELDENNYATFYEYDEEGRLIRIKRETERGIVTIKESRTGIKKTDE